MGQIKKILEQRGEQYGPFRVHALITQDLEAVTRQHLFANDEFRRLPEDVQKTVLEGFHMVFHKMARICNGNPLHQDSYDDIVGYAQLMADVIKETNEVPL
jgi:hypothetical protein